MVKKLIKLRVFFILFVFVGFGCTHTIRFRSVHFATPVTGENTWDGQVNFVAGLPTDITLFGDIRTNPPTRGNVLIDQGLDSVASVLFPYGFDFSLSTVKGLDIFFEDELPNLKYQFLNHGAKSGWVGAIQLGYGGRKEITTDTAAEARSIIKTTAGSLSIGYVYESGIPYLSYTNQNHNVTTDVTNSTGDFGPYTDVGTHETFAFGVASSGKGLSWGVEYAYTNIKWDRGRGKHEGAGFRLGYAW